jgi:hypothetical protein
VRSALGVHRTVGYCPTVTTDEEARRAGFINARDMKHYADAMEEEEAIGGWIEAGAPSPMDLWRQMQGVAPVDARPLTIEQAARRENVSQKTIRRKLRALAAMDPPGAYRVGDGDRAPWRIIPAALDALRGRSAAPEPATPARARRKSPAGKKRSATRWEV